MVKQFKPLAKISAQEKKLPKKIEELGLSEAITRLLKTKKITTVKQLLGKTEDDLAKLKGVGKAKIDEIKKALKKFNLSLKEESKK